MTAVAARGLGLVIHTILVTAQAQATRARRLGAMRSVTLQTAPLAHVLGLGVQSCELASLVTCRAVGDAGLLGAGVRLVALRAVFVPAWMLRALALVAVRAVADLDLGLVWVVALQALGVSFVDRAFDVLMAGAARLRGRRQAVRQVLVTAGALRVLLALVQRRRLGGMAARAQGEVHVELKAVRRMAARASQLLGVRRVRSAPDVGVAAGASFGPLLAFERMRRVAAGARAGLSGQLAGVD
jgi:hypothetical protein